MTGSSRYFASRIARRFAPCLVLAAMATTVPVTFELDGAGFQLEPAAAFAKSGKGKGGTRDDDDDDRDDRKDRDRADDRDGDRDGDRAGDDDRDHDGDRDDGAEDSDRKDRRRTPGPPDDPRGVVRVELSTTGINVIYRDGSREGLSNGLYRREDASGRVLASRAATGADRVRLRALAGGRAVPATRTAAPDADPTVQGHPKRIRLRNNDVIVEYTDGWTEAVERGRYRLTDRYGHVAVNRKATEDDIARLRALAGR